MAKTVVIGLGELDDALKKIPKTFLEKMIKIIHRNSILLATHMKQDIMTGGTTKNKLAARSGRLRASTKALSPKMTVERVEGGVRFGTNYAGPHIGEPGTKTTITPKSAKYLTIPTKFMKTKSGQSRGSARGAYIKAHYDSTFVKLSKAGNLVIFGVKKLKTKSKIIPLFILKQRVEIPARIHPSELLTWVEERIMKDMRMANG